MSQASDWPSARTRLVGLLGWPSGHSLSPVIHNRAFHELGIDAVYLAFPASPDALVEAVSGLAALGAIGANVTIPHKQAVVDLCDRLTDEARLVGAVNTLTWTSDGLLEGHNTDAEGAAAVLADVLGDQPPQAVMLGTGGAARAVAVALGRVGAEIVVVGRDVTMAERVGEVGRAAGAAGATVVAVSAREELRRRVDAADVVINATPLGMDGEPLPAPFHSLHRGQVAFDLVYNPPRTPFLAAAEDVGAVAIGGLGMLVAQAAAAFERWTGERAPREAMASAARAGLANIGGSTGERPSRRTIDWVPPEG